MEYNCKIIELDDQPVITVRRTNPVENLPAFFGEVYGMMAHYLGEMGERLELFSEPYNRYGTNETVKGWAFCEMIGFVIPNARAVAKGSK